MVGRRRYSWPFQYGKDRLNGRYMLPAADLLHQVHIYPMCYDVHGRNGKPGYLSCMWGRHAVYLLMVA